ncbi:unnamed protein product, partial [marine sediment metagenome]
SVVNQIKDYIKNRLENLPPDKRARFLDGTWTYFPGACYSNIHEENKIDVEKNIYHFYDDIVVGVDWGHYMCANIWGIKVRSDCIEAYCIHEIVVLGGVTKDLITELDKVYGIKEESHILYCDHEPDRILELQSAGYAAKSAYKDVGAGDSSVNVFVIYFDNKCDYTYQSMVHLSNQEDPRVPGTFLYAKHIKENDHEADGARYALHGWRMDNEMKAGGHHILGDVI